MSLYPYEQWHYEKDSLAKASEIILIIAVRILAFYTWWFDAGQAYGFCNWKSSLLTHSRVRQLIWEVIVCNTISWLFEVFEQYHLNNSSFWNLKL